MKISELDLPGVLLIEPDVHGDSRGFFKETWNVERFGAAGFPDVAFVQDNHSRSRRGVLRGLHYQLHHPQGKLIQVTRGEVFDVAVDIRVDSPTYRQWTGCTLSDENHHQLWIPPGFAHGFCALSDVVDLIYKCTSLYKPEDDYGLIWNDASLGIRWPIDNPTLSEKDNALPSLEESAQAGYLPKFVQ